MGSDGPEGCYIYWFVAICPFTYRYLACCRTVFPEMQRKCLKLTLHLPYSQKKMVMSMLAYGVLALVTCFAMSFIMMGVYLPQHFTSELVQRVLLSAAPWFLPDLPVICLFHGFAWNPHGSAGFWIWLLRHWFSVSTFWLRERRHIIVSCPVWHFIRCLPLLFRGFLWYGSRPVSKTNWMFIIKNQTNMIRFSKIFFILP